MSFENTKCPCGGTKTRDTMLCAECEDEFRENPDLRHDLNTYPNPTYHLSTRRSAAMRLVCAAARRKSRGSIPLEYRL